MRQQYAVPAWFQKKGIHKVTWQHPGSKKWHYIDYAIMSQSQCKKYLNISVMQGAQCNSDHLMLWVKGHGGAVRQHHRSITTKAHRNFDVSKLKDQALGSNGGIIARGHFQEMVIANYGITMIPLRKMGLSEVFFV